MHATQPRPRLSLAFPPERRPPSPPAHAAATIEEPQAPSRPPASLQPPLAAPDLPVSNHVWTAPPELPHKRGPTCTCSLIGLGSLCCLVFFLFIVLEIPLVELEGPPTLRKRREHALELRRQQQLRDSGHPRKVLIGLWDQALVITPLELTVAFSIASGVREEFVHVHADGEFFFDVHVDNEGPWLVDALHDPMFMSALNSQARMFGATLRVAHEAREEAVEPQRGNVSTV